MHSSEAVRIAGPIIAACLVAAIACPSGAAEPIVVSAGQAYALDDDLVLDGDAVLEVRGTAERPCTLVGNRRRIRSGPNWTGIARISHCRIRELGGLPQRDARGLISGPGPAAIDVTIAGRGSVEIESCTFDACSGIHVRNDGESTTRFRNNTVLDNTVVATSRDIGSSGDAFVATGGSRARKLFQGNFIPRGKVVFRSPSWLVGGDRDADSNLFLGLRIGIDCQGDDSLVRGNYFHLRMPINDEFPYWSQVSVVTAGRSVVTEHNVIRDGEWIVRFVDGEFRYNVVTDIVNHDLMQNGSAGRIHHNLFLAGASDSRPGSMFACIAAIYPPKSPGEGIEIYNNVFDGGGRLDVPAIEIAPKAFATSVRNNVFFNFAHSEKYYGRPQGMIRTTWNDETADERLARLGYADYNLFYSPAAKSPRNYLLSVAGKAERKDAGFGRNDVPRGGKADEQADPRFRGPIPKSFPYADADIAARKVGVSKMLTFYREAYSPADGSPLIGGGDPADGDGTSIGAVGGPPDRDRFGRFGMQEAPRASPETP